MLGPDDAAEVVLWVVLARPAMSAMTRQGASTNMRNVEEEAVQCYRERWDLLEQPAESVSCWLADWVFKWAERTGLPDGHPGLVQPNDGVMSEAAAAWLAYWLPAAPDV